MPNIFFTSDEHHGHRNIIKFCGRPFIGLEEMTEALIDRHNSVVKSADLVYHCGDMFWRTFGNVPANRVMDRLNGHHFYILGNHEELIDGHRTLQGRFVWVKDRIRIKPDGGPKSGIVLDHYAGRVWDRSHDGSWQLYGHSHAALTEDPAMLSCDVGVDAWNYYPVSLEEVRQHMDKKMPAFLARKEEFAKHQREGTLTECLTIQNTDRS